MTTYRTLATTAPAFNEMVGQVARDMLKSPMVDSGAWQGQKGVNNLTFEVMHARVEIPIPFRHLWADMTGANLPWAEDHFLERVGGTPVNPPPSSAYWPYATKNHEGHVDEAQQFSHTYPERFWPQHAGGRMFNQGIRFRYGDWQDLVDLLIDNPYTRQAYLPIWFPEDLGAAIHGQRVPCTLGYHFLIRRERVDVEYHIRSCDLIRHFRDDVYMAGRLVHEVIDALESQIGIELDPGTLIMNIGSFHAFPPDKPRLEEAVDQLSTTRSQRLLEAL